MTPLLEYTLKVSVIVLAGLVVTGALRRRSAAGRHWVLSVALISALALPIIGVLLPAWSAWTVDLGSATAAMRPSTAKQASAEPDPVSVTLPSRNATVRLRAEKPGASAIVVQWLPFLWAAGTALSVLMLVVGLARLTWLSSRARPVADPLWARVLDELAHRYGLRRSVRVLESEHPSLLVTWGAFRPQVIVPRLALDWPEDRIRVVLSHELAHIRRGDWAMLIGGEVLRSINWFNPLIWITCRSLRQESEEACDDEVMAGGVEGADYAAHLLDAARALKHDGARWLPAPAVVRPSSLERRIRVMLNTGLTRTPVSRSFRLVAAAQMSPAVLTGSVVDASGAPTPGVTVTLASKTTAATFQVQTDVNGQFQFVPLPADEYTLGARLEGFKPLEDTVRLAGKGARRDLKLEVGTLNESIHITGGPRQGGVSGGVSRVSVSVPSTLQRELANCKPAKVGGNLKAPIKLKDVRPDYAERLQAAGITGTVILTATIGTDGKVANVEVTRSVHPDLDAAAIDAVRQWEFDPPVLNCVPTEAQMTITLRFSQK